MIDIISIAKTHFAKVRSITIPEWIDEAGKPVTIFWKPITGDEQAKFVRMSKAKDDDSARSQARLIVSKAQDEAGQPVFNIEQMDALCTSVDFTILARIAGAMLNVTPLEDLAKN